MAIKKIMLFAAGLGTRMDELTKDKPKPLIEILNKPLLHLVLESIFQPFRKYLLEQLIINIHYYPEQIEQTVKLFKLKQKKLPEIVLLYEKERLETGGAIKNAHLYFKDEEAIFTINSDSLIYTNIDFIELMKKKWNPKIMDFLLLLVPIGNVVGDKGKGDFNIGENNKLIRNQERRPYLYTGVQILKPALINKNSKTVFSLSEYYINENNRIYGCVLEEGKFLHANTPEDINKIQEYLKNIRSEVWFRPLSSPHT